MLISIIEIAPVFPAYQRIWQLRNDILRKPLGLILSKEEVLNEADQIHLAAFDGEAFLGCVLLTPLKQEIKLRQMAVSESFRGRGIGRQLLLAAENLARKRGYKRISCHARETAMEFYQANGWAVEGKGFIEVTIPHVAMSKTL